MIERRYELNKYTNKIAFLHTGTLWQRNLVLYNIMIYVDFKNKIFINLLEYFVKKPFIS